MKKARSPKLDILAIAAHPDDAELTCGGTLAQAARRGQRAGVLDLTRGEAGTRGTPGLRAREAACAARALGLHHRENLGLPDSALTPTREAKLAVAARLRALRPRVVILPLRMDRHPDHAAASQIGYEACFLAGLKQLDLPGAPHRPFKILYAMLYDETRRLQPSFVVDVGRDYRRRQRAIACYRSQFTGPRHERGIRIPLTGLLERLETECRYFGEMIHTRYGEPFLLRETLEVEDVLKLSVRSI